MPNINDPWGLSERGSTSFSRDNKVTCIACGMNVGVDQFSVNVHRDAHRQADRARTEEISTALRQLESREREVARREGKLARAITSLGETLESIADDAE